MCIRDSLGMNHAAAEDFNPALALAETAAFSMAVEAHDVDFGGWLREGKVMGTEPDDGFLAVKTFDENFKGAF